MKRYKLKANKTKFVALLRYFGYKPTVKRARLEKAPRSRAWWLSWSEPDAFYEALLDTAAMRAFLRVTKMRTSRCIGRWGLTCCSNLIYLRR